MEYNQHSSFILLKINFIIRAQWKYPNMEISSVIISKSPLGTLSVECET